MRKISCPSSKYRKIYEFSAYKETLYRKKKTFKNYNNNIKRIKNKLKEYLKKINKIIFFLMKNFDFVKSQQSCFTVQNANIRICSIYRKYREFLEI